MKPGLSNIRNGIGDTNYSVYPTTKFYNKIYGERVGSGMFIITTLIVAANHTLDFIFKPIRKNHTSVPHEHGRRH